MKSFAELNLSPAVSRAVEELGYTVPTPVQAETLPLLLAGPTDFMGLAATGTGKTAAFAIPMIERIDTTLRRPQALVLCPTRELALQVCEQVNLLGKHKGVRALPIFGGAGYGDQLRGIKQGIPIIVATPGRLVDHLNKGSLSLEHVTTIVLDEADEMISMGFKDDLEAVLEQMEGNNHSTWLFSATMSSEVRRVADRFLNSPKMVQINKTEMLSGTVEQIYYKVREGDKAEVLCKLIDMADDFYGLVFCQTKSLVDDIAVGLKKRGYSADCLHGDMDQAARDRVMKAFRERRVTILVCTDVACRGLDVKDLTHVINYSIPRELDNYVHRIGRTGRSGKTGLALSLVTQTHMGLVTRIERMTRTRMTLGVIPNRKEIARKQMIRALNKFQTVEGLERATSVMDATWDAALEGMTKQEIAARFLALNFSEIFVDREELANRVNPAAVKPLSTPMPAHIQHQSQPYSQPYNDAPYIQPVGTGTVVRSAVSASPVSVAPKATRVKVKAFDVKPVIERKVEHKAPEAVAQEMTAAMDLLDLYVPAHPTKASTPVSFVAPVEMEEETAHEDFVPQVTSLSELLTADGEVVGVRPPTKKPRRIKNTTQTAAPVGVVVKPQAAAGNSTTPWSARRPEGRPFPKREFRAERTERPARTFGARRDDIQGHDPRPSFGHEPKRFGDSKPSFAGAGGKPSFGRPSFGAKPSFGKPAFGSSKPSGSVGGWKKKESSEFGSGTSTRSEGGFKPLRKARKATAQF